MHQKWRRHGWETLPVHVMGIKSAMVHCLCKLERREDKGEGRGFAWRGRHAGGRIPKRRKRRGKGGDGGRELIGCQEKGKRTVHEYGGCGIMPWLREDRVLVVPDTDGVCRACHNSDLACIVWAS